MYLCDAIWRIYRPIWNAVADNAIETRGPWYAINRSRELKRCTRSTGTEPYISWKLLIIPLLQSGQVGRARCTCADSFHPLPKRGNATRTVVSYSTFLRRINSSRYINLQISYSWVLEYFVFGLIIDIVDMTIFITSGIFNQRLYYIIEDDIVYERLIENILIKVLKIHFINYNCYYFEYLKNCIW